MSYAHTHNIFIVRSFGSWHFLYQILLSNKRQVFGVKMLSHQIRFQFHFNFFFYRSNIHAQRFHWLLITACRYEKYATEEVFFLETWIADERQYIIRYYENISQCNFDRREKVLAAKYDEINSSKLRTHLSSFRLTSPSPSPSFHLTMTSYSINSQRLHQSDDDDDDDDEGFFFQLALHTKWTFNLDMMPMNTFCIKI